MTTTQAIKLLKNGEAQLYKDCDNLDLLNSIIGNLTHFNIELYNSPQYYMFCRNGNYETSTRSFAFAISTIKLSEIQDTCKDCEYYCGVKVIECTKCNFHRKSVVSEKSAEILSNYMQYIENFEQNIEAIANECKNLLIPRKNIQSLKPTPMQVTTNENGEITLSGITIDNDTVDRIVAIRKEQIERPKLEVGKWYCIDRTNKPIFSEDECKAIVFKNGENDFYGFDHAGNWTSCYGNPKNDGYMIKGATDQEVTEALHTEFKKKYKVGNKIKFLSGEVATLMGYETWFIDGKLCAGCNGEWELFKNGKWATIIPTYTHADLEKKLGETFNYKGE